jgi:hypothetical protein
VWIQLIHIGEDSQSRGLHRQSGTGFDCTDDSDKLMASSWYVPAWCEQDETATERLLLINQWNKQWNEQSKNPDNQSIELRIGRHYLLCRRPLKAIK